MKKEENKVFLLVGQRGSGKTHYGKRLLENQPELKVVSRDEVLVRLFGSVHTNPYTGGSEFAFQVMSRVLRRKLSTQKGVRILLDCWTGDSRERKYLIKTLRDYGANRVVALYFVTPIEDVRVWFWQKPGIAKMSEIRTRKGEGLSFFSENAPNHDHELFHRLASSINSDGFDKVIRVNPKKELIVLS